MGLIIFNKPINILGLDKTSVKFLANIVSESAFFTLNSANTRPEVGSPFNE